MEVAADQIPMASGMKRCPKCDMLGLIFSGLEFCEDKGEVFADFNAVYCAYCDWSYRKQKSI